MVTKPVRKFTGKGDLRYAETQMPINNTKSPKELLVIRESSENVRSTEFGETR
jgi:hypothetical protein